jgi:YXWGXW repeat-containing protein
MKIKVLLLAALVSAATLSAQAGVHFSFWFNVPVPAPVVVVHPPVPYVVAPPLIVTPPVATVAACPGPGYVWAPGYWSGRVWVAGCWRPGSAHYDYDRGYVHYDRDRYYDRHDDHFGGWHHR